jgi:hypothetical protein
VTGVLTLLVLLVLILGFALHRRRTPSPRPRSVVGQAAKVRPGVPAASRDASRIRSAGGSRTDPFARRLLGATVHRLWRLVTVSTDGTIPLLGTLALETDTGFVTLSYTQGGLSCHGPLARHEIRWETEPDLAMGKAGDAEEWLDLAPFEDHPNVPPLFVESVTGWFGVGPYVDTFALILTGRGTDLVIMTTDEFDLRRASREEARQRAELVAANMNLHMVDQERRLDKAPWS